MIPEEEGRGFAFLFRTDRGRIDRATWWRGILPLAAVAAISTGGWLLVRPYTQNALEQPPALAVVGYLYLLAFSFCILILLICQYNLSAKRFVARGLPRAAAAAFPLTLLLAAATLWVIPRSTGALPLWSVWPVFAVVLAVTLWNLIELGFRSDR